MQNWSAQAQALCKCVFTYGNTSKVAQIRGKARNWQPLSPETETASCSAAAQKQQALSEEMLNNALSSASYDNSNFMFI